MGLLCSFVSSATLPVFGCVLGHDFRSRAFFRSSNRKQHSQRRYRRSKSTTNSSIRDRQTMSIISLQSPIRLRIEVLSTKNRTEKPFSKKERSLRLCSLQLHDLFPTFTSPPERLEPKSVAGSATRHAKRVTRGPESVRDACEICAAVRSRTTQK